MPLGVMLYEGSFLKVYRVFVVLARSLVLVGCIWCLLSGEACAEAHVGGDTKEFSVLQRVVGKGDSLTGILRDMGVSVGKANKIIASLSKVHNAKRLGVGDQVRVKMNNDGVVDYVLVYPKLSTSIPGTYRDDNGNYGSRVVSKVKDKKVLRVSEIIRDSFFVSAVGCGLSSSMAMELVNLYSSRIDFKRITPGSRFEVLFERFFDEEGKAVLDGRILYAFLQANNKSISFYRHLLKDGTEGYFDSEGLRVRRSILEHPIGQGVRFRVSSKFGMRKHPISGYSRFHSGVDYAAPLGTPVRAAGDGIVEFVGVRGGYGNYVKIRHGNNYSTAYAHLWRVSNGLRQGSKVRSGQVIAYVGSTGLSTGPHLHYEVLYRGQYIDPQKGGIMLEVARLPKSEESLFQLTVADVNSKLNGAPYVAEFAMARP